MSTGLLPLTWQNNGVEVIIATAASTILAQGLKIFWHLWTHKRLNFKIFFHTGGMPSSHSASVCSLATSVGLIDGFNATTFAIAAGLAVIVMYDAAGVRRAAGNMAGILNRMTAEMYANHPEKVPERLRELLGHTPFEVVVGAFLGGYLAWAIHS